MNAKRTESDWQGLVSEVRPVAGEAPLLSRRPPSRRPGGMQPPPPRLPLLRSWGRDDDPLPTQERGAAPSSLGARFVQAGRPRALQRVSSPSPSLSVDVPPRTEGLFSGDRLGPSPLAEGTKGEGLLLPWVGPAWRSLLQHSACRSSLGWAGTPDAVLRGGGGGRLRAL